MKPEIASQSNVLDFEDLLFNDVGSWSLSQPPWTKTVYCECGELLCHKTSTNVRNSSDHSHQIWLPTQICQRYFNVPCHLCVGNYQPITRAQSSSHSEMPRPACQVSQVSESRVAAPWSSRYYSSPDVSNNQQIVLNQQLLKVSKIQRMKTRVMSPCIPSQCFYSSKLQIAKHHNQTRTFDQNIDRI